MSEGRYDEAIDELRAAVRLEPAYRAARERLVRCFERSERYTEAIAERESMASGSGQRFAEALENSGAAGYRAERCAELRAAIDALRQRVGVEADSPGDLSNPPHLQLALAHAELGEWDAAYEWEERAAAPRPGLRQWFIGRPELERLASRRASTVA